MDENQPPTTRESLIRLETSTTAVEFDQQTGTIRSLVHAPTGVEFAGNPDNNRRLRGPNPPALGHVRLRTATRGAPWALEDTRCHAGATRVDADVAGRRVRVTYRSPADQDCGLRSVQLEQEWTLLDQAPATAPAGATPPPQPTMRWRIRVRHAGDPDPAHVQPLRIGEVALPMVLNTHFGGRGDQDLIYDQRVMMHCFACGHSGYVVAQRLSGQPPMLVMVPTVETPLEAMAHDDSEFAAGNGWDGLLWLFCWSHASAETLGWKPWYHGHRTLELAPGQSRELGFDLYWANDDRDVERILDHAGHLVIRSHPGFAVPISHPCTLRLGGQASSTIRKVVADEGCRVAAMAERHDARLYDVRFDTLGEHVVTVHYGDDRWTNVLYNVLPDARQHMLARTKFIVEKQHFHQPGHRMDSAFMMWDSEEKKLVIEANDVPWLVGGSDEGGLAEPLVLAVKNACVPDAREIAALEEYVDKFCFGVLQKKDDFGIRNWVQHTGDIDAGWAGRTNRSFNYPHVWNIYYYLYRAGRLYGLTHTRTPEQYLEMAYHTAIAYFTLPMHKEHNITKGNMGEDTLDEMVDALASEGHEAWAGELRRLMQRKVEYMTRLRNPYLSELNFDTTGYAGAWFYRRLGQDEAGARATLDVIMATRHRVPGWPWYASDVRWGWGNSKFRCGDEICFNYMTGQNALPLLRAFERAGRAEHLQVGYAALLAVWVLVEPDGTAHDFYGWEPARRRFDPWTSEMGHALFPSIRLSKAYVVEDEQLGLIGYGCRVEQRANGVLLVEPVDAIRQTIWVEPRSLEIGVDQGTIEEARFGPENGRIELRLKPALESGHQARLVVRGDGVGERYTWRLDDHKGESATRAELDAGHTFTLPSTGCTVSLSQP